MNRLTHIYLGGVALLIVGLFFGLQAHQASAADIPAGCRAATTLEKKQLEERGAPNVNIVCGNDAANLNLGEFEQFYARLKATSPCSNNKCTLACRTRNTGAQVCGPVSRKYSSQGCHQVNNTAIFPTVSHGFAAHIELLKIYCSKHGKCTLIEAISRWAPAGHANNNPSRYAATVSKWAGIPVNQVYDPNNVDVLARIALSMSCVENGAVPYNVEELKQGIIMAGGGPRVPIPANVGQLVQQSQAYTSSASPQNGLYNSFANSPVGQFLGIPPSSSSSSIAQEGGKAPDQADAANSSSSSIAQEGGKAPDQADAAKKTSPSPIILHQTPDRTDAGDEGLEDTTQAGDEVSAEEQEILDGLPSATSTNTGEVSIKNAPPSLLCLPNPVTSGEKVLITWACRDGSYKAVGENFDTNNAVIGQVVVTPDETTDYTVTCIDDVDTVHTQATCSMEVATPALAIIATPSQAARGSTVQLSWKTKDITSCRVSSPDIELFEKGGREGSATSPALREDTRFVLTCETITGSVEERILTVPVR